MVSKTVSFKIHYNAPVVLTFALLASLVFLVDVTIKPLHLIDHWCTLRQASFLNPKTWVRILCYPLGHASLEHLSGNLLMILLLGPVLEEKYGSQRFLAMMVFTAVCTGVVYLLLFSTWLLGASGLVFMMIILSSLVNLKSRQIPLTFLLVVVLFLGKEVIEALKADKISQFAHLAGGVCGALAGWKRAPVETPKKWINDSL